jgi:LPPG:FO 2-phospho-L-lactate transferase
MGLAPRILPMSDEPVRTQVRTAEGWIEFQEYFVHQRQAPDVLEIRFDGAGAAAPTPEVEAALGAADAVVLCPSNPLVSIGPILAVPGLRELIAAARARGVPVAAVSPIIGGRALKGPADRMLAALGHESSALGVARLYADIVDVFVLDNEDAASAPAVADLGPRPLVTDTIMTDDASRARLAVQVLRALDAA